MSEDNSPNFESLNLAAPVQKALTRLEYKTPTPIQQKAIPDVLDGKDLMGIAQTGTGKTAAFSLPTLSHIARNPKTPPKRGARVLILAPTRELASQIAVSVKEYGVCMPELTTVTVYGGVPISRQIKRLVRGNDVVVATPGRLIDLIGRKDIRLGDVEVLILDEADQMMDMGFIHALRQIIPHLPKERQTLFFSATMTPPIKKLASQFLTNPVHVSVSPPNSTAEKVEQSIVYVDQKEKQDLLAIKLLDPEIDRALIFTRTKHGADRVVKKLGRVGIAATAIHGNKSQGQRRRALEAFKNGDVRFLVATDIAARGIDIDGITHVINFEVPNVPEQYVHRIGRTARAGRTGRAISFVAKGDEREYLKRIQKLLKATIAVESLPDKFNAKAAEVNKRPALPKPDAPSHKDARKADLADKARQAARRRPKKRKKPKTAEQEMAETNNDRSANGSEPKSSGSNSSGSKSSGSKSSGSKSSWHKSSKSKSSKHRTSQHGSSEHRSSKPKSSKPHGSKSGGSKPKTSQGHSSSSDTSGQGSPKPTTSRSKSSRPPHPKSPQAQSFKRKKRPGNSKNTSAKRSGSGKPRHSGI